MKAFDSIPEPWAMVVAPVATAGMGVLFCFLIETGFGLGVALGAVVCMAIYWAARLDERPFWQHVFGRETVYSGTQPPQAELEEEVLRLKLKVAELLGQHDRPRTPGPSETRVQTALENPAEHRVSDGKAAAP